MKLKGSNQTESNTATTIAKKEEPQVEKVKPSTEATISNNENKELSFQPCHINLQSNMQIFNNSNEVWPYYNIPYVASQVPIYSGAETMLLNSFVNIQPMFYPTPTPAFNAPALPFSQLAQNHILSKAEFYQLQAQLRNEYAYII